MKERKKLVLVQILDLIKEGSNPSQISKKYNIPKTTLQYSIGKLKKRGCIKKKGYGVWEYIRPLKEVPILTTTHYGRREQKLRTSHKKEIRGHAFIWKIKFYDPYDWEKTIKNYKKKKLTFQLMKNNNTFRTIYQNRKIWLGKKTMIIYEPIDFIGISAFEVKGRAVFEMDLLIKGLLNELGLKFRPYKFTTSREHYGIIKNELARQYNDKKEKMAIRSDDGDLWMWIDDSLSLGELENNKAPVSRQVQQFWNDHKNHDFKVDASFILNTMNGIQQNQMIFDKNMTSHLEVLNKLGDAVGKLTEKVDSLGSHTKTKHL